MHLRGHVAIVAYLIAEVLRDITFRPIEGNKGGVKH